MRPQWGIYLCFIGMLGIQASTISTSESDILFPRSLKGRGDVDAALVKRTGRSGTSSGNKQKSSEPPARSGTISPPGQRTGFPSSGASPQPPLSRAAISRSGSDRLPPLNTPRKRVDGGRLLAVGRSRTTARSGARQPGAVPRPVAENSARKRSYATAVEGGAQGGFPSTITGKRTRIAANPNHVSVIPPSGVPSTDRRAPESSQRRVPESSRRRQPVQNHDILAQSIQTLRQQQQSKAHDANEMALAKARTILGYDSSDTASVNLSDGPSEATVSS